MEPQVSSDLHGGEGEGKGWRFWTIFIALSITSILSALDTSVISTAMPTIVHDLDSSSAYVWIANAYFLTSTAFQPLYGQSANIFGRRSLIILSVVLFAIGSAVSGSARSTNVLIVGRTIQGVGGGGINVLVDIIVSDLVPLRERPKYMGVIFSVFAVALSLGPVIGGIMTQRVTWRWIFYMNLPISGAALVLLVLFLRTEYKKNSIRDMLKRVDLAGNALLVASVLAVLLALTWGGTEHPWSSWRTILPLVLGSLGLVGFMVFQASGKGVEEPTMPIRLFANRTSLATFGLTFLHAILTYWMTYFLPVYFQAVLEASPTASGVDFLPSAVAAIPFAILAGAGLSILGRYRPFQFIGVILLTISFGLLTRLNAMTSTGYWVGVQILAAAGSGVLLTTTLPAIQAPLPEADVAVATATWAFLRSFGGVWGVTIPSAVFNSRVNALVDHVKSSVLREELRNGGAYALASKTFMQSLDSTPGVKAQVLGVYIDSLRLVWQVGIAFGLLALVVAFIVKEVPMREQLETKFGLTGREDDGRNSEAPIESAEKHV
ncbi:putative MFS multidrug transporter [Aspergillus neoniger CBS 115656]|uniref:Multidrug resistance protein Fnx1 n=1 Tax=Aspergillus neoniger (strain CBS 115656) TaxID=1448310 RepID=A0A318Y8D1_ASPNB|nr:multidrug resistance protein Fnx1 [Aspergillus neoniger CBS 115656]PYH30551.1 multidrug resistance protein Fnx1 [Aspergillus neoniger CBS 115656]